MDKLGRAKYKVVKNFLSQDEINLCAEYLKSKQRKCYDFAADNINYDSGVYKDFLLDSILKIKKNKVEEEVGLRLNHTYSFWRCYTYKSTLDSHKDRPSCEYSVTIFVDADKPDWPIYMEGNPVSLKPGDAVFYKGCELEHWREPYEGDYHFQFFLHYVNKDGPFADYKNDKINDKQEL
tara:strand:- start:46 stop:582 length:537 start_codon:yes stop_codon:yes gene_type:complete